MELRYRPLSHAAHEMDALARRFTTALTRVRRLLGLEDVRLPRIVVSLADMVADLEPRGETSELAGRSDRVLALSIVHSAETPCVVPEIDLSRLLLARQFGALADDGRQPLPPVADLEQAPVDRGPRSE